MLVLPLRTYEQKPRSDSDPCGLEGHRSIHYVMGHAIANENLLCRKVGKAGLPPFGVLPRLTGSSGVFLTVPPSVKCPSFYPGCFHSSNSKSFLVGRFREIAREYRAPTALTNEAEAEALREQSIVKAMGRLAHELKEAGTPLAGFEKRYEKYKDCMLEIEADPDAPRGAFELFGRTAARVALGAAKVTPAGAAVGGLLAGSAVEEGLVD